MTPSTQFITHIAAAGERWDLLAWRYYGDASVYSAIIMANPTVAIEPVLAAGLVIAIPILEKAQSIPAQLPPWKQGSGLV